MEAQDDCGKWRQIPAFGDWNMWEEMPVTQYFEPAATFFFTAQAGEDDVDLFKVPHFAANPYTYKKCVVRVKKGEEDEKPNANPGAGAVAGRRKKGGRKQQQQQNRQQGKKEQQQRRKKPKAKKAAAAAAVDEDLYKISPNVICKVQKKKLLRNLLGGCLGLNCIA
ncbi:hypothetical protein CFC21_037512 [Triticum aestivum]|uniref:Uncharacterized protein n=3 Tax=Triticum TaxID=4564 RepID=A0A9R0RVE9_TRITD|nr:uncharacterized protein LOC119270041 [Triticum dicoccoides]XP_044337599.1 uncharacterized protein LOC123058997 [Triticum aestivum]KAF7025311.1 hypothetical protein CFC21_037512 [Triticum aestivum]VAH67571.1 unnamed protein product [Triticum turgidum subsp. durum]